MFDLSREPRRNLFVITGRIATIEFAPWKLCCNVFLKPVIDRNLTRSVIGEWTQKHDPAMRFDSSQLRVAGTDRL